MTSIQRNLHNEPVQQPKESEPRKKTFSIHVSEETFQQLQSLRDVQAKEMGCRGSYNMAVRNLLSLKTTHDHLQQKYDHLHENHSLQLEQENHYLKELLMQSLSASKNMPIYSPPYPNYASFSMSDSSLHPPPGFSVLPSHLLQNSDSRVQPPLSPPAGKKISNYTPPNTENLRKDYQNEIAQIFTGELLKPSQIVQTTQPDHASSEIQEISADFRIPHIDRISTAKGFSPIPLNA